MVGAEIPPGPFTNFALLVPWRTRSGLMRSRVRICDENWLEYCELTIVNCEIAVKSYKFCMFQGLLLNKDKHSW